MTRFKRLALSMAVSNALLPTIPAAAATFSIAKEHDAVNMIGEIVDGDADRLTNAIVFASNRGWDIKRIWMHSPGGELEAARQLGELVKLLEIQTGVAPDSYCVSACVLIFAAGNKRVVYSTSRMGVHSAGDQEANDAKAPLVETEGARATSVLFARRMAQYGAPASVVTKLITTPPTGITWLNASDYRAWSVEVRP